MEHRATLARFPRVLSCAGFRVLTGALMSPRSKADSDSCCPLTREPRLRLASEQQVASIRDHFPAGIAAPALRALYAAGCRQLSDLKGVTDEELLALHGMGPKALKLIRQVLPARN